MKEDLSASSLASDTSEKSASLSSLKPKSELELSNESGTSTEENKLSSSLDVPDELNPVRLSVGPVDLEPPEHLQQQTDDQVLADFFGTFQLGKLNQLKKGFSVETEEENRTVAEDASAEGGSGLNANGASSTTLHASSSQPSVDGRPPGEVQGTANHEPVSDMVSEMQKLRMRLQEETRQELAAIDRQFSPKLFARQIPRLGHGRQSSVDIGSMRRSQLNPADGSGLPQHAREGSLDSSIPNPVGGSLLEASFEGSRVHSSGSHARQSSLPVENIGSNKVSLPSGFQHGRVAARSPSPRLISPGGTHYDSYSLERTRSPSRNSRSPTPPYVGGHFLQGSIGSSGGGGGNFSPPHALPSTVTTSYQPQPQARVSPDRSSPYNTPPLSRAVRVQQYHPQQNLRQAAVTSVAKPPPGPGYSRVPSGGTVSSVGSQGNLSQQPPLPRSTSGGLPVGGHGHVQQPRRVSGGSQLPPSAVVGSGNGLRGGVYGSLDLKQSSNKPISNVRNGLASVPRHLPSTGTTTHYSTSVIRGKKHKLPHARSVGELPPASVGTQYDHLRGSGQMPSYDRLGPQISNPKSELDQPEQRGLPRAVYRQQSASFVGKSSRGPLPNPPLRNGPTPGIAPVSMTGRGYNGAPVYPEAIEPYMTSASVKQQMHPFMYKPYSDKSRHSSSATRHNVDKRPGSGNYDMSEQTWC